MKITKQQLKQIIKEELRDYYDGESHSQSERDATQPRRPEEVMREEVIDKVKEVLIFLKGRFHGEELAEAGQLFGDYLRANIQLHIDSAREREPEEYTGEELPQELEL
jgi:hypothetical protein